MEMDLENQEWKIRLKKGGEFYKQQNNNKFSLVENSSQRESPEQPIRAPRIGMFRFSESLKDKLVKLQKNEIATIVSDDGGRDHQLILNGLAIEKGEHLGSILQMKVPFPLPDPPEHSFSLKRIYMKNLEDGYSEDGCPVEYNEILFTVIYN